MLTRCIYCSYQGLLTQCTLPFPPLHIHLLRPLLFNVHIHSTLHAVIMLFLVFNFLLPRAYLIMPSALCSCTYMELPLPAVRRSGAAPGVTVCCTCSASSSGQRTAQRPSREALTQNCFQDMQSRGPGQWLPQLAWSMRMCLVQY